MTASSVPPSLSRLVGREELLEVLVLVIVAAFLSAFIGFIHMHFASDSLLLLSAHSFRVSFRSLAADPG